MAEGKAPTGPARNGLERGNASPRSRVARRRVLATLPGIAADHGHGKTVVMAFGDEESYYQYIANYGSESSQPEAFSGGMFIDAGYGHFVFAQGTFETMEPVVVHELTHCLVRHLPIPAWLNEGPSATSWPGCWCNCWTGTMTCSRVSAR